MLNIYLNGTELTNVLLQTPYKDTLDKELDQLNIVIKSESAISFKKNDKIRYLRTQQYISNIITQEVRTLTLIDKIFCLFSFLEKKDGAYYTYELNMLSPTKLLENIIINGMASTNQSGNLNDQITNVIAKINAQMEMETHIYYGSAVQIVYEEEEANPLEYYETSDFLWDGQQTAREILNDIAYKADRLVIGTDFTASGNRITQINITTVAIEKSGRNIATANTIQEVLTNNEIIKGYSISFDSEFANGKLISLIKNAISKDNIQSAYLPPRNDDITIDSEDTWHILTNEPIYSLNKVIAMMPIQNVYVYYWYKETIQSGWRWAERQYNQYENNPTIQFLIPVDITNYVVEKDVFDAMPITDQAKHLYFKRGERGIYGLYDRYKKGLTGLFSNTALKNIASNIGTNIPALTSSNADGVIDWSSYNFNYIYGRDFLNSQDWSNISIMSGLYINCDKTEGAISRFVLASGISQFVDSENAYKQSLFSINYQPYVDSVVLTEKTNLNNAKAQNMAIIKNQSDRTIDASKYYDSQKAFADRMGNNEAVVNVEITDLSNAIENTDYTKQLWDLGDYFTINGTRWTCVSRELDNETSANIKVKYTFSEGYNAKNLAINENRDKRLYGIPLNQYVDRYIIIKESNINQDKMLVKCWDDFTGSTTTQGYCLVDGVKLGNDKKDLVFAFKDNYAVDIEKTTYSGVKVNVNLRYCNKNTGELETLDLILDDIRGINERMASTYYGNAGFQRLPFMLTGGSGNYGYTLSLNVKKDKMERLIIIIKNMNV